MQQAYFSEDGTIKLLIELQVSGLEACSERLAVIGLHCALAFVCAQVMRVVRFDQRSDQRSDCGRRSGRLANCATPLDCRLPPARRVSDECPSGCLLLGRMADELIDCR